MNRSQIVDSTFSAFDEGLRRKNRGRPRLLVYTDSRGLNFASRLGKRHYGSHVSKLQFEYDVTYAACPEKHTTIVDFLNFAETASAEQFDATLMHCGIVDFSPRPLSNIEKVRTGKLGVPHFDALFTANAAYHAAPFETEYYGERTTTLYSPAYLEAELLPRLLRIPRLVWITSNPFVQGWEGNYARGRPANIGEVVSEFDAIMAEHLSHVVDLRNWTSGQIQRWTLDNIHFTRAGFTHVFDLARTEIRSAIREAAP